MINVSNLVGGVVNIGPAVCQPVEALSWDITLGTAGTGLGQLILGKTSSSSEMVPEAVDHVGVIVFGFLYEYGDLGILKTAAPLQSSPKSKYPVFYLRSREKLGDTAKSQEEFEEWVDVMNQTDFQGSGYDVVKQSCVVWGIRACEFLGVDYPENWDKVCNWAAQNSTVASLIGGSGVNSRKVQIKAQTAQAPKKLYNYMKKKLKRKGHVKKESGESESGSSNTSTSEGGDEDEENASTVETSDQNFSQSQEGEDSGGTNGEETVTAITSTMSVTRM
ncbi:uncharacterized protein LOC110863020 [Folsomia candida]|uniref:PPPDE domain-containing protein n=1 Tax=Folsomia candida TaxID=158441 RepID=A0A226F1M4_FOLCA|nr:uncharacterized protein LOC110863020 [Folsomia candida]OXA63685.1 hypothetical protein Fcan01_01971 [Folsomia candida]